MSKAKEIRAKIASIKSTQKITKAMEMVAASKMRNAQASMQRARPYARHIRSLVGHVATATSTYKHPYMLDRKLKRVGYIVVSSDRGLCGGLNLNLFKALVGSVGEFSKQGIKSDFCLFGNKAITFFKQFGGSIISAIPNLRENPSINDLVGAIKTMLDLYDEGTIDQLYIAYNQFVNTMTQKPVIEQLIPLQPIKIDDHYKQWDYIYEPGHEKILHGLIIRYIESQIYNAVVDNFACEQAARMVAMKSATENAGNLTDELQLIYNKARQAAITQEISEIVGGSSAV